MFQSVFTSKIILVLLGTLICIFTFAENNHSPEQFELSIESIDKAYMERFGFKNIQVSDLKFPQTSNSNRHFNSIAIVYREAGWTIKKIEQSTLNAFKQFANCGVSPNIVRIFLVDSPFGIVNYITVNGKSIVTKEFEYELPQIPKPLIFFMGDEPKNPRRWATATHKRTGTEDDVWLGSLFVFRNSNPEYVGQDFLTHVLTHELGHIFNLEHSKIEPNPMYHNGNPGKELRPFSSEQCKKILESSIVF